MALLLLNDMGKGLKMHILNFSLPEITPNTLKLKNNQQTVLAAPAPTKMCRLWRLRLRIPGYSQCMLSVS